ncbi:hypothetical protein ACQEV4_27010 [Streptomyces shenzhenensis]
MWLIPPGEHVVFTDTHVKAAANAEPFPTVTGHPRLAHHPSHRARPGCGG